MTPIQIILLIIGIFLFIGSFFLVGKNDEASNNNGIIELTGKQKEKIEKEIDDIIKKKIDATISEAENSLKSISNDKVMSVTELSDTVLEKIKTNHSEVVFMYDMLNSKEEAIKKEIKEADRAVQMMEEAAKISEELLEQAKEVKIETKVKKVSSDKKTAPAKKMAETKTSTVSSKKSENIHDDEPLPDSLMLGLDLADDEPQNEASDSNEEILRLYKSGKNIKEISKLLGIGQGEVKLVITLYGNEQNG